MRPHFLFPEHPLRPGVVDDAFADQFGAVARAGFATSLCADSILQQDQRRPLRGVLPGSVVCFRGWMMNVREYARLTSAVEAAGATMLTSLTEYLAAHHLPNWYPLIAPHTPETRIFPLHDDLADELRVLGWDAFFIKDYVKSLKTSAGSILRDPSQIGVFVTEMRRIRGEIEGGLCVRRVEDFLPDTERRYFVIDGRAFAAEDDPIPDVVMIAASRIPSRLFSVDVIQRRDGVLRIVEVGDGQVSDLVGWSPERFAEVWTQTTHTA